MHVSQTSVYAEGVGLGASKGKEIEKYAEGFSSYSTMVQDSVSSIAPHSHVHGPHRNLDKGTVFLFVNQLLSYDFS